LEAIYCCHEKGIIHRDLKLENLLICGEFSKQRLNNYKLIDFGFATQLVPGTTTSGGNGTKSYQAPEVIQNLPYTTAADMWSIGVISYIILGGYPPFQRPNEYNISLNDQIIQCKYEFHHEEWKHVSEKGKNFIRRLLHPDPRLRMHAREALEHPFITDYSINYYNNNH